LFTPYSTRGRASGAPQNWIYKQKSLKTIKIVILKKYVLSKKDFYWNSFGFIIFPGKLYFSFF
jgi:hypothetical protein